MKKKRFLFRRLILMATALLMVNLCLSAVGESYSANVMRLLNYEGEVHILDADGSNRFIMENARFNSGESLITSEGAMASVGLDATKVLTLDSMTQVTFLKENNHMTLTLSSGRLLLDVQQKLDENESFDIQTSTMTVGIRGTITYLTSFDGTEEEINQLLLESNQRFRELLQREMPDGYSGNFSQLVVLEGTAVATFKNEQGQLHSVEVHAGEKITMLDGSREAAVVPAARSDLGNDMVSFIQSDPALSERVEKASDILDDETKAKLAGQAGLHIHQFYVDSSSVPPTCSMDGYTKYICDCGKSFVTNETALGHDFGEWETVAEPDCTHEGKRQRVCTRCEETEQETIPAKGHTPVTEPAIAATCTASGWTEHIYCSVCEEVLEPYQEEIPALGHNWGEWVTVTEPDCTHEGKRQRVCARCEEAEQETIPAKGHTPVTDPAIAATCTASGWTEHIYCSVCEEVLEPYQEEIPALGHNWGEWETVAERDCTHEGKRQRICGRCEEIEEEALPALGHDWGEWTVVKEATEQEGGLEQRTCSREDCGATETQVIPFGSSSGT